MLNEYGLLDAEALEQTKERIWARFGRQRDDDALAALRQRRGGRQPRRGGRGGASTTPAIRDWGQEGTGRMTGICAAVGAQLLGRHGRTSPASSIPRRTTTRDEFLAELGRRGSVDVSWRRRWR